MLVSAISVANGNNYNMSSSMPYYGIRNIEKADETVFNSLAPFKGIRQDKEVQLFDHINEWQNFCHKKILGQKLDIMA